MGSPRIKGTGLTLRLGGPSDDYGVTYRPEVDYWADATTVVMDWDVEYTPMIGGGYEVGITGRFIDVTAVQSTDPDSLWTFLFEHYGQTLPFAYAPHGNEVPTQEQPHFTGLVTLPGPPALGGAAGKFSEYTFTARLFIVQGPLRVTE